MSLLKNELCKLLSKKAAWILLLLILVNPLALIYIINTPSEEGYTIKEYSSVYRKINGLNENSALEKIENCLNETESYGMMNLCTRVYSEVEGVFSYGEYLDEIDKKTEDVNIMARFFNNGTYAIENARKTQQAYQKLKGLTIKPVDPSGILCLTDIGITDYILLLIIFILAVSIIFQEKDNNQFKLLRTMEKGRISIMLSKIMVMIISIVAMTVILYGTNYGVARANFGIPDFTTPIQSLYVYRSCPFNLNIGSFLISYIVIKILGNILIGMFFLVICAVFDSFIYVFMSGAVLVFIEILLYTKISETHYLAYLKFINIMYGIKTVDMLSDYINLNVLGHPVNTCIMYGIMWLILFMCSIIYLKNYLDVPREKKQMKFGKLKIIRYFGGHTSIFRHESYKVMIAGRALFILILFIGFIVWWNPPMNMSFNSIDEVYYKEYMDELYGPLDSEIYSKFNEEKMKYDELSDRISADMEQGYLVFGGIFGGNARDDSLADEQQPSSVHLAEGVYIFPICKANILFDNYLRSVDGHRIRVGRGVSGRWSPLQHVDKCAAGLARLDWQHFGLCYFVCMDARGQPFYLHKARNIRYLLFVGIYSVDVFFGNTVVGFHVALDTANDAWSGVCVPEHNVYGFAARQYGFSAFFSGIDDFQQSSHGDRRLYRLRVLWRRSQLLHRRGCS